MTFGFTQDRKTGHLGESPVFLLNNMHYVPDMVMLNKLNLFKMSKHWLLVSPETETRVIFIQ